MESRSTSNATKAGAATPAAPAPAPAPNPFKRPMNPLQKQWYRILLARRVGFGAKRLSGEDDTNREPTYQSVCQKRYKAAFHRYNEQFRREIQLLEEHQRCAIDATRIHRHFAITTLWPPLHSRLEINSTLQQLEKVLSVKERRRLEEILRYGSRTMKL